MDNNKVMIVGTGNVGASIAYAILNQRTAVNEIAMLLLSLRATSKFLMAPTKTLAIATSS